jgi:2-oxoglutarate dehydrogenase E2 component (dihydrolipoamide succinyltransferase)
MPQLGETVEEGTVSIWHKKVGDIVVSGENLFDVSTDKVEMEIPASTSGELLEILVLEGETVAVGVTLAIIDDGSKANEVSVDISTKSEENFSNIDNQSTNRSKIAKDKIGKRDSLGNPLSPVVRRLLTDNNISPDEMSGSGSGGRITRGDVLAYLNNNVANSNNGQKVVPFDSIRKLTAEHMKRSKSTSPHVLQAIEVDYFSVNRARSVVGEVWKAQHGFSLTYLPFIAKAFCQVIKEFPRINAHVLDESLLLFDKVNLGIAVDLNFQGLVVPVIKNADDKSVAELAKEIWSLSEKARNKKLLPDEMTGGTYTISNSGAFGSLITAPVINQPQVAILSTDGVKKKPVVLETDMGESIAIRPVGVLAQSFDHRAIDGAYSAAFLKRIKDYLQDEEWNVSLD